MLQSYASSALLLLELSEGGGRTLSLAAGWLAGWRVANGHSGNKSVSLPEGIGCLLQQVNY